ncbi:unnamed protein product [Caenorhabditis auriculariae]|uniref:Pecanex-like protein n=1 Tax=Caenorhabditis auriculariae TaxID=2777116 RepID=A0A8S1HGF0_9PELO|nr:unnamed protein product [Caenorhabditis auriculariae]
MTVTSHIGEILRQGIWASLTGGWYYEPSHSIFCNTVHVYIWLILLLVPLVLGIFMSGSLTYHVIIGYCFFTALLFSLIKTAVSYLHKMFDTTDPVVVTRTINDSIDETMRDSDLRLEQALDSEMIELRDMGFNVRGSTERTLENANGDRDSTGGTSRRPQGNSTSRSSEDKNDAQSAVSLRHVQIENEKEDNSAEWAVEEEDEDLEAGEAKSDKEKEDRPDDPTIPFANSKLRGTSGRGRRKYSEPTLFWKDETEELLPDNHERLLRTSYSSGAVADSLQYERMADVRELEIEERAKITLAYIQRESQNMVKESEMLIDRVVETGQEKKPSETKTKKKKKKGESRDESEKREDEPSTSQTTDDQKNEQKEDSPSRRRGRTARRKSSAGGSNASKTKRAPSPAVREGTLVKRPSQDSTVSAGVSTTATGWAPVVVSLGDIDRPTTSRISVDEVEESGSDIKVEITKFLEDLIDKHPETLDAIESVRMSRLGLGRPAGAASAIGSSPSNANTTVPATVVDRIPQLLPFVPNVLRNIASRRSSAFMDWHAHHATSSTPAHHIASGHEDTTQGAVHSFQDEEGNWWTYTFDENGVGTAQPLGSGRALMDLLHRERERTSSQDTPAPIKAKPWSELEVLPENMYDSTDEEKEEKEAGRATQSTTKTPAPSARRERAMSSSSNESCTYIPTLPSSVFHAPSGAGASRGRTQMVSFSSRVRNNNTRSGSEAVDDRNCVVPAAPVMRNDSPTPWQTVFMPRVHGELGLPPYISSSQDRALHHLDSSNSFNPARFRFFPEMALTHVPPASAATPDFQNRRSSNVRRSYYYQMKVFPEGAEKLEPQVTYPSLCVTAGDYEAVVSHYQHFLNPLLDRPSIDRLFDRNRCMVSFFVDIILASLVSALAALVLNTDIFFDHDLVIFALVVAGSQYSLLKSVQPDASSPIHGFNWMVAYSRPVYFCVTTTVLLALHHFSGPNPNDQVPWNWNPYRLYLAPWPAIMVAARDIVASVLLFLPVAFTLGWLPQVNTLTHHILEQVEMHVFGGTASFGVFSAFIQLMKSIFAYLLLTAISRYAYFVSPNSTQSPAFSVFVATTVSVSYLLSRVSSNQQLTLIFFENLFSVCDRGRSSAGWIGVSQRTSDEVPQAQAKAAATDEPTMSSDAGVTIVDNLPATLRKTVSLRARHDFLFVIFLSLVTFALHSSSIFTATQPYFTKTIISICVAFGILNHYLYPQFRAHTPWKIVSRPILRSAEYNQFECPDAAKLMIFEVIHAWMGAIERNIVYPLMVASIMTESGGKIPYAWIVVPLISMRILRGGYTQPQMIYVPLAFSTIASLFDWHFGLPFHLFTDIPSWNLMPPLAFLLILVYPKFVEFYLKINFVMAYVAPWQISWGSAFHAFAQPFSLPHSALIGIQTVASSIFSAPLNPFLGSSFFTTSYVRPVKFWERDYNTKRADASNMRLSSQLDRGPMLDDSNLNAVFYEHLTRSLQKSLAGDIAMGRWATSVQPGDCFILASFYLNCLVHIIEVGNGFITFQLRGLEFRGTYCHQREVEAISEDQSDGSGCCCCSPGSLPGFLSLNTAWGLRWLAWEVVSGKYIIDGYSISDNSAVNLLQVHELRRLLVTLYVKCIIYYTLKSSRLAQWIENESVSAAMDPVRESARFTDLDSIFCSTNDEDFDQSEGGISRTSFSDLYTPWINHCVIKRSETFVDESIGALDVLSLCYLLSLVGRRALGTASYNRHSNAAESFLYGLHALFKGDFRITCQRDEWVFADMDLLRCVVAPAVKMALKLHQDHFAHFEEFDDSESLYDLIADHQTKMFISHEQDPGWRRAILANTPSLLALRHMYDDGQDDYKIIMLNRMHLNMRVIKLNRECVRAFWAGQQQELIFLRNRNPERGSIQNARQVLRNMINSSADQPVGYPIYVSPLTTSLIETHSQIENIFGPTTTIESIAQCGRRIWNSLRSHFGPSGSNSANQACGPAAMPPNNPPITVHNLPAPTSDSNRWSFSSSPVFSDEDREVAAITQSQKVPDTPSSVHNSIVEMTREGARVSVLPRPEGPESSASSAPKQTTALALAREMQREKDFCIGAWVQIMDCEQIFKYLNEPLKSTGEPLVVWPDERLRVMSGRSSWIYQPVGGMCGRIVFTWSPNHPNRSHRSHVGDYIHLVAVPAMTNGFVAVGEKGCRVLTQTESAMQAVVSSTAVSEHVEFMNRVNDVFVLTGIIPSSDPPPPPKQFLINPISSAKETAPPPPPTNPKDSKKAATEEAEEKKEETEAAPPEDPLSQP